MSKLHYRLIPVNGYDIPAIERWLEEMAAKGLLFSLSAGPLALFEEGSTTHVRIHLEPCREKTDQDDLELNQLYGAAGWTYLGIFRKNFYVYSTHDLQAQAHTDQELLDYSLKRFAKQRILGGIGLLLFNLFLLNFPYNVLSRYSWWTLRYQIINTITHDSLLVRGLTILGLLLIDFSYVQGLFILFRLRRKLKKDGVLPTVKKRNHGGRAFNLGVLILLVVLVNSIWVIVDMGYERFSIEETGWVSLADVEGDGFTLSPDYTFTLGDALDYNNNLLSADTWYSSQHGSVSGMRWPEELQPANEPPLYSPEWKIRAYRFALPWAAEQMMTEQSRYQYGTGPFQPCPAPEGLDEVLVVAFDAKQILLLRSGSVFMRVEYRGLVDLTGHLELFAQLLVTL